MLQKRIERIAEYFGGIEMSGGLFIVKVHFKNGWSAYGSQDGERIKVAKSEQEPNVWFYYGDSSVDLNQIFDLIEETIEMNESVRKKIELLKVKVDELKTIFNEEPLSRLETLYFSFAEEKKTKKKNKRKVTTKTEEENITETV